MLLLQERKVWDLLAVYINYEVPHFWRFNIKVKFCFWEYEIWTPNCNISSAWARNYYLFLPSICCSRWIRLKVERQNWSIHLGRRRRKIGGSADKLADSSPGKNCAGGLDYFQFYRTIYADQLLLFVLQADSLFAHFFACVSPASLVTLESQADYSPFGATVNTPRLWKLLEFTRLHGSSRQKYLMMSKRLSFRLLAFHKGYLSILSALSGRVFRAYESLLYPGFISFDALPRSTYLNSVDRAFFVRHTAL